MAAIIRTYRNTAALEYHITLPRPDGRSDFEERRKSKFSGKSAALRAAQAREIYIIANGLHLAADKTSTVPTLKEFAPKVLNWCRTQRQKPSGLYAKEEILRNHLYPELGARPIDRIANEDIRAIFVRLEGRSKKRVNNVLSVLNMILKKAVEWTVIDVMPCTIRLLKVKQGEAIAHDNDAYEQLITAASAINHTTYALVLLGGEGGLRRGEIMALEWRDVDFMAGSAGQLKISRSVWVDPKSKQRIVTATKGRQTRFVPMTDRLAAALYAQRQRQGTRAPVVSDGDDPLSGHQVHSHIALAATQAGVSAARAVHTLRHTFCSHLAAEGAPMIAIQYAAGHEHSSTTQRYMHLTEGVVDLAIGLLNTRKKRGEMREKVEARIAKLLTVNK